EGVRVWVNDDGGSKASGNRGGFAVGGYSPSKAGFTNEYLRVTPDSVRVYIDDDYIGSKAAGNRGGFAVGGFSPSKGFITNDYLFIQDDSTRVYVTGDEGFAVDNIELGNEGRYMDLTPNNYFIGHESGDSITTGLYNSYFGYQTGKSTKTAYDNVFLGYQSGFLNSSGGQNVFIGKQTGFNNTLGYSNCFLGHLAGLNNIGGYRNVFIGQEAGYNNLDGFYNIFLGYRAGMANTSGSHNDFIGYQSGVTNTTGWTNVFVGSFTGYDNLTGFDNVFLGASSGANNIDGFQNVYIGVQAGLNNNNGDKNVFIGYQAGGSETGSNRLYINNSNSADPLIYGQFDNNRVGINDGVPSANLHIKQVGLNEEAFAIENDGDTDTWSWEIGANDLNFYFNGIGVGYWDDATGNYTAVSDRRLKKDIETINEPVLHKVLKLEPVSYRLNHADVNSQKTIGFIAQDVQKLFPELVKNREDGYFGLNYDNFGIIAIKAIQEQQEEIEALKIEIEQLKQLLIKENTNK
ncbi:MAG: tail fiber domain-containing protein, partial [Bacteroidota bacterium]